MTCLHRACLLLAPLTFTFLPRALRSPRTHTSPTLNPSTSTTPHRYKSSSTTSKNPRFHQRKSRQPLPTHDQQCVNTGTNATHAPTPRTGCTSKCAARATLPTPSAPAYPRTQHPAPRTSRAIRASRNPHTRTQTPLLWLQRRLARLHVRRRGRKRRSSARR